MAAAARRKRPQSIINLLGDVVDDTKELVDDALDRSEGLQRNARRAVRHAVSSDVQRTRDDGFDSLRSALDDLTAKVDRLASLQAESARRR